MKPDQATLDGVEDADVDRHMIVRVNARAIKMVHPFKAENDVRFYLMGINIRPLDAGGVMIVATDGHRYIVVRDPEGYAEHEITVQVSKDAMKHASSAKNTFDVMANGSAMFSGEQAQALFIQPGNSLIHDANYPRIERIASFLGYKEGISGSLNPTYLADLFKLSSFTARSIKFFTRDSEDSPLQFVLGGIGTMECFGGVMKMREELNQLPDWFPPPGEVNGLGDV